MTVPLQITFRHLDRSEHIEALAKGHFGRLVNVYDRIVSCHVIIDAPHRHHRKGNHYHVDIHLTVPQRQLVVDCHPTQHDAALDLAAAVREAFDNMRRQLAEYVQSLNANAGSLPNAPLQAHEDLESAKDFRPA
jgi:ribosome-associated translation inhibitor RaiA